MSEILTYYYIRVSSEDQKNNTSPANQEDSCNNKLNSLNENLLPQNLNYTKQKIFFDDGIGGDKRIEDRPKLKKLFEKLKKNKQEGKKSCIIFYSIDRIARSLLVCHEIFKKFEELDCEFHSCLQNIDNKTFSGKMIWQMLMLFAEYELETIRSRISNSTKIRKEKGNIFIKEIYGYNKIRKANSKPIIHELQINEEEAKIVKKIFTLFLKGGKYRDLVNYLDKNHISTKQNKSKWDNTRVARILKNPVYTGIYYPLLEKKRKIERKKIEEKYKFLEKGLKMRERVVEETSLDKMLNKYPELEEFKVEVPQIIEKKDFDEVQEKIKERLLASKRNVKNTYLFSKIIYCSEHPKNSLYAYTDYERKLVNKGIKRMRYKCSNKNCFSTIQESRLEANFLYFFDKFLNDKKFLAKLSKTQNISSLNLQTNKEEIEKCRGELALLDNEAKKLDIKLEMDRISSEEYKEEILKIQEKIKKIEEKLIKLEKENEENTLDLEDTEIKGNRVKIKKSLKNYEKITREKREIFWKLLLKKILVDKDKKKVNILSILDKNFISFDMMDFRRDNNNKQNTVYAFKRQKDWELGDVMQSYKLENNSLKLLMKDIITFLGGKEFNLNVLINKDKISFYKNKKRVAFMRPNTRCVIFYLVNQRTRQGDTKNKEEFTNIEDFQKSFSKKFWGKIRRVDK